MADHALSDIKVLDFSHIIAGPYCTKLLADYGADVIKVERPDTGDGARRLGPFPGDVPNGEQCGLFLHLNTNKRSITLNLKTAAAREIVFQLVKEIDIVVESFRPGTMAALGLDYATLKELNPRLVMTSVSNFGQSIESSSIPPEKNLNRFFEQRYAFSNVLRMSGTLDIIGMRFQLKKNI